MIRLILLGLLYLVSLPCLAASNVLNVYNWADFMPRSVIKKFEKRTGITVNYIEFDSNETLYAKLKANPKIGFDVIVPSSYYVERMSREHMLHKLDLSKLPNHQFLNPALLNKGFDPNNQYSLPFMWGTTGITLNDQYYQAKDFKYWSDLWKPAYKNQLLMLDDMREVFSIALIKLGYSINDKNPKHIKQAYLLLRKLLPNIKLFNSDAEINLYVDADIRLGMGWSGDVYLATLENSHIQFVLPKDHLAVWIDCVSIPEYAPHLSNAYKFINFINEPAIAAEIAESNGYSSPNLAAIKLLPQGMQTNKILNPSNKTLERSEVENDVGAADAVYEKYWQLLKLG
jgi:spermidine/putrescine transport system substrate-binding protein